MGRPQFSQKRGKVQEREKNYKCGQCGEWFMNKHALKTHEGIKHG